MSIPTSSELALLKTRPQQTKLWLSVHQPTVALACQVNDASITKGAMEITYDNVTSGSRYYVGENFVMLVGTTPGGDDKGRIRVRSITSSVITVAENSHINWEDNDYLTILRYIEINPIFTRIIQNPADELDVIFYKDYDIEYTNQNEILGAFINMGSHFAGFIEENGVCSVYYSASGTSHLIDGTTLTYDWFFEGAQTTGSSALNPGYINYDTPGHYLTRLIVSGSNGSVDRSYRCISIYDHPSRGTNVPILDWESEPISGNRESGGYKTRIRVRSDVAENVIRDGAQVTIFSEDWYGNTKQSIGGNALNRSNIRFVGYILNGTIEYNYADGYVEFEVVSPTGIMQHCESFSVSVESKSSPSTWYELLNMNGKRAIYHYLRWHSTVLQCCDFEYRGDDYDIQYFDADRTSLYDAINSLMDGTYFGNVVCDRQGKLWAETSYKIESDGGSLPTNMTITKLDWMSNPIIDERQTLETSFIEMGGIKYDGPTAGTFQALLCSVPGNAPEYRGKVERIQGLALESQNHLNTLAGNYFAHINSRYPGIDLNLSGNYTNFDIAPQEIVKLNIEEDDTPRKIVFNEKKFAIEGVSLRFDRQNLIEFTDLNLAEVVSGTTADTIIIPDVPPTDSKPPKTNPTGPGGITPGNPIILPTGSSAGIGVSLYAEQSASVLTGTSTAFTAISWDTEIYDTSNFWTAGTGSASATITFPSAGNYLITVHAWLYISRSPEFGGDPWTSLSNTNLSIALQILNTYVSPIGQHVLSRGLGAIVAGAQYGNSNVLASTAMTLGLTKSASQTMQVGVQFLITDSGALPSGATPVVRALLQVTGV